VKRAFLSGALLSLIAACSGLPELTPAILTQAEEKWNAHKPVSYNLVVEMSGDRVETGRFEVEVRGGQIVSLRRNGLVIRPNVGQDYSMDGLLRMLDQELSLTEKPAMLGAPEGYSVYTNARFDDTTGRLLRYRRIVGGISNSIEVTVLAYDENVT
jgi:hypothetical protein